MHTLGILGALGIGALVLIGIGCFAYIVVLAKGFSH